MFDDKSVRPWDVSNLEDACFGGRRSSSASSGGPPPAPPGARDPELAFSAYMLFYERKDSACFERTNLIAPPPPAPSGVPDPMSTASSAPGPAPAATATPMLASAPPGAPEQAGSEGGLVRMDCGPAEPPGPAPMPAPLPLTPYGMPLSLYEQVLRGNLQLMHRLHVLDKEYFRFIKQVGAGGQARPGAT